MTKTVVLVCQNADCKSRGSEKLLQELSERLKNSGVEVKSYMCFGACQAGPNIVVYPQKEWYCNVESSDVDAIAGHARGGPAVDRLTKGVEPALKELIYQLLDAGLY